ncbi:sulfhydryl oxidase 2 isoform X1 [Protopterus annectens]|uniref:sulfhydryl oxidase 2 isoform X1 n=1 Tax=Protopterus annectens TaxID=7888 RepID=UPI001CFA7317|nr:sulfhydryl oxidase 2 isoform X1 [Protopterus annectens]
MAAYTSRRYCWLSSFSDYCIAVIVMGSVLQWGCQTEAGKLYTSQDAVVILESQNLKTTLLNSSSAWVVEFYSSWCGHCISYASTWKALALDVKDWGDVIKIGVLDCAEEENFEICKEYGIQFYPTFRYFKAFSTPFTKGENYQGSDRELQTVRQIMIDFLQNHTEQSKPLNYPSLEPIGSREILALLDKKTRFYTAVIFEDHNSYVGREVILDLIPYENILVKRTVNSDKTHYEKLGITAVPSCYLIYPNGSHELINNLNPLRSSFSSFLKSLSGVRRKVTSEQVGTINQDKENHNETESWREFEKSKLYASDLESGLHYLLRVELANHKTLEGDKLKTFKDFIAVTAKLFPGQQTVVKLLETLQEWLVNLPLDKIPYNAVLDLVNNKLRIAGIFLTSRIQWVSCQGSKPEYRGYPCSLWRLFHTLTVQAAKRHLLLINTGFEDNPQIILQIMRRYIQHFFGCRECAHHFEEMAKESMHLVKTLDEAVLWLWKKHNVVNNRLAGSPSEDPKFPKLQWPTPDLCPACHEEVGGLHTWNEGEVLNFLRHYYSEENISYKYTDDKASDGEYAVGNGDDKQTLNKRDQSKDRSISDAKYTSAATLKRAGENFEKHSSKDVVKIGRVPRDTLQSVSIFGIGFSNVDMSLCVVLYVASCLFLMILYFFFRMRSKRWKVKYLRPYV